MSQWPTRRDFLETTAVGMAAGLATPLFGSAAHRANQRLVVGVMGVGGRGTQLASVFQSQDNVDVAYVCDADSSRMEKAADEVARKRGTAPAKVKDFRRILDDKAVDVLVVATCNHWHAPASILACAAGKHVYVEKPCSHNPREGELLVESARKHQRHVQMGNQRRSWPSVIEAVNRVRKGDIGRPYFAQSWYENNRPSIGRGKATMVPAGLDYALWEGPAPHRDFRDNFLHYNWHWFWNWGNGELGNNGVHFIDVCRWGLGVDYPLRVASAGGRFAFRDDQETPDTHVVSFDFPDNKAIVWQGLSCSQFPTGKVADVLFVGDRGSLAISGGGYSLFDPKGKLLEKVEGKGGDESHVVNFLEAIRSGTALNSEIAEGAKSTLLCHLGNIAHRIGRSLTCDLKSGAILGDADAMKLWTREYAKGWEPRV